MAIPIKVKPLGIFLTLLPVGAYLGMKLQAWTVWQGVGSVAIGYLLVVLHRELD